MNADELKLLMLQKVIEMDEDELLRLEYFMEKLESEGDSVVEEPAATYGLSDWQKLSEAQRQGIEKALDSLDKGVRHDGETVFSELRQKYGIQS